MRKITFILLALSLFGINNSCTKYNDEDYELLLEELGGDLPEFYGRWVRVVQASGDETDIAIGNITGQPENRVYMCEKEGSTVAGFYKGTINGSIITWDAVYGIPDFHLSMDGADIALEVPDCPVCITTYYVEGPWSGECGPL